MNIRHKHLLEFIRNCSAAQPAANVGVPLRNIECITKLLKDWNDIVLPYLREAINEDDKNTAINLINETEKVILPIAIQMLKDLDKEKPSKSILDFFPDNP